MTPARYAIGDRVAVQTPDRLVMQEYGIAWHRRDVATVGAIGVVVEGYTRPKPAGEHNTASYTVRVGRWRMDAVEREVVLIEAAPAVASAPEAGEDSVHVETIEAAA